jgi:hypothetical protein
MLETEEAAAAFLMDASRRRSIFYVPLNNDASTTEEPAVSPPDQDNNKKSIERIYNPDLSACSFDWSLNDSINSSEHLVSCEKENRFKRYGIVLNGSVNIDDSCLLEEHGKPHQQQKQSTPIRLMKSRSRNNILAIVDQQKTNALLTTPVKEKSKTLPQNMVTPAPSAFPPKSSFILKSTPKMSLNYSSSDPTSPPAAPVTPSPKKSLSFIRRTHSTKLSRSNSLLKSLTSKCVDQSPEYLTRVAVTELKLEHLELFIHSENSNDQVKEYFFKDTTVKEDDKLANDDDNESGVHSGNRPTTFIY